MSCKNCGVENRLDAAFCCSCGGALGVTVVCVECRRSLPATHAYCDACGTPRPDRSPASYTPRHLEPVFGSPSAVEGANRVVTVMFADIEGFTAIADKLGSNRVREFLAGCFKILGDSVHRNGGTLNQYLGDGIMALFGAPVAHEDDAARALRAALAIRGAMQEYDAKVVQVRWQVPCRIRIGIDTGTVAVGPIGDDLRRDYTAQGDTTNLAKRLQEAAPPGAIWVSQATHDATRGLSGSDFVWEPLGQHKVRNRQAQVFAYELLDLRRSTSNSPRVTSERLTPLIGREEELGRLEAALTRARAGEGRVVSVIAEAGLGKTRLVHEFRRKLSARSDTALYESSCFDHGTTSAYLPFRALLRALFQVDGVSSEEEGASRVAKGVAELGLDAHVIAAVLNLLSYPVDESVPGTTSQVVRDRTIGAIREVIAAAARRQTVVLVIEDLHWIDQATQDVLNRLVEDARTLNLLLVLVFRPEYLAKATDSQRTLIQEQATIRLSELPAPSQAEMVRAVLRTTHAARVARDRTHPHRSTEAVDGLVDAKSIPADLEQFVRQSTEGNPLFIEELVLSLVERGALARRGDDWIFEASLDTLSVPDRVQNLFAARVDRLDEEQRRLLNVASVIGRVFTSAILAKVLGLDLVEASLAKLEASELIYRLTDSSPPTYSFKHVLCRDAVYGQILEGNQKRYHEQVAQAIESVYADRLEEHCELLVYHYTRSAALPEAEGSPDLLARRAGAVVEASDYPDRIAKALEYLVMANRKAIGVGAMIDAQKYFTRARLAFPFLPKDVPNQRRKLELVHDQVFVALALFSYREYHSVLLEHAELAENLGDRRLLGALLARIGWCQWSIGDFADGIVTLDRAVEHCEATSSYQDLGLALMTRAWCELDLGDFLPALSSCEEALLALTRKFDLQSYVRTRAAATAVYAYLGQWQAAIKEGNAAMEMAAEHRDPALYSFAAMVATWNYAFMGDLARAHETGEAAVKQGTKYADELFARGSLALVECRRGNAAEATERLHDVVRVIRPMKFPACETFGLYYGEALYRAGRFDEAKAQLAECLSVIQPSGAKFYVACAQRLLGEIALVDACGETDLAARHFEASMATFERLGAENELALAYAGYGRLLQTLGEIGTAREYFSRALGIFERIGTQIEPDRLRATLAELG